MLRLSVVVFLTASLAMVSALSLTDIGELWIQATQDLISTLKSLPVRVVSFVTASPAEFLSWSATVVIVSVLLYYVCNLLFSNYDRVRPLHTVGYEGSNGMTKKQMANKIREWRKGGDVPPVFPNGWFTILESRELAVKQVKDVYGLGLQLAVFRDESGEAHIVDAYCPHMGANLAIGGQVKGDCVECPFHGWKFRGEDGKCQDIPYMDANGKIPEKADIKAYPTLEINGFIHIWYHAEGDEPYWMPPELENITNGNWAYRGRTEHYVNCHIEEIPENGADIAHLQCIHKPFIMGGVDLDKMLQPFWEFGEHVWKGSWEPEEEKHRASMYVQHSLKLFGFKLSFVDMNVRARQIGPGFVYLTFVTPFGSGCWIHTLWPVEPMLQKLTHQIYFTWYIPPIIPKFYMYAQAVNIERDIMVWNHKTHRKTPIMVKSLEDATLIKHRRWYAQFYSENSPRLGTQKQGLEW